MFVIKMPSGPVLQRYNSPDRQSWRDSRAAGVVFILGC